jgi:orotidine-5'-phosphate decarboxylase
MSQDPSPPRIVVALDFPSAEQAWALVESLEPGSCRLKVGKELFTRAGPRLVEALSARGFDVFLDLKFHDIPNTVAGACAAAADLGVWMMNVHASGGRRMMAAARERLDALGSPTLLTAVTLLTSLGPRDLAEIGYSGSPRENVLRLARLARDAGADGVVCSPLEASDIRAAAGEAFLLITPGVRPAGAERGDQRRVTTPGEAMRAGADYLVVGRPVTASADPAASLRAIRGEIAELVD